MNEEKVYVVYTEWRYESNENQIVGIYRDENKARKIRQETENEIESDGYEAGEDFRVWFEIMYIE